MSRGFSRQQARRLMLVSSAAALTAACSSTPPARTVAGVSRPIFSESQYGVKTSPRVAARNIPKGGGIYKLGAPYQVAGRWYVPREDPNYLEYGVASWYGADFHGRQTANGEVFDANALTAAHPTLPLPSYAYVTNLDNGKTVLVRVNDRGPYVDDRVIDMSYAAAKYLGYTARGKARVRVRYAGRAPLNGDDRFERRFLASQQRPQAPQPAFAARGGAPAPAYAEARRPAEPAGRWSPTDYRAGLAGRPMQPVPSANARFGAFMQTGSLGETAAEPTAFAVARGNEQSGFDRTFVQVGIFRERANAERLHRELGTLGPTEVTPMQAEGGREVYRVRVGPFSPDGARHAQAEIERYGVSDSAIVTD